MCDITKTFKATVKTVKTRQKSQGLTVGSDRSILQTKTRSEFSQQAVNVVKSITALKEFLLQHREDYIDAKGHVGANVTKMSDFERDKIDSDAAKLMQACSEAIRTLKSETSLNKVLPQVKEHRDWVFIQIENYLKATCKIYSEQRAIRVKRVVDKKKISRLEPEVKKPKIDILPKKSAETNNEYKSMDTTESEPSAEKASSKTSLLLQEPPIVFVDDDDDELSPEEAQMFEQENQQLYEEMNSVADEVKNIESKVVEISRLQEIFTDKILDQEKDIDRVADTVVGTTENIKEANEEIREAMKNNAGLRVWILFFLLVCSFSLLFLDWYNA